MFAIEVRGLSEKDRTCLLELQSISFGFEDFVVGIEIDGLKGFHNIFGEFSAVEYRHLISSDGHAAEDKGLDNSKCKAEVR